MPLFIGDEDVNENKIFGSIVYEEVGSHELSLNFYTAKLSKKKREE